VGCHHGWRAVTRDEIHQAMEDDRQEIIGAHYDALLQSRVLS
jgi:hypothetical protein